MNDLEDNWYIEYDYKIFEILKKPKFDSLIFSLAELFSGVQGPSDLTEEHGNSDEVAHTAESIMEITNLLYNFFNVEEKLTNDHLLKTRYFAICSVLKIEKEYCKYFFKMSKEFRINRILACCLRLNRFMRSIFEVLAEIKKKMDSTFLENLSEVYLFMGQRLRETLQITREMGDHDLNIILLNMLILFVRNNRDEALEKILHAKKEAEIIESILKSNEIYQEFMSGKISERKHLEETKYLQFEMNLEEDPNIVGNGEEESEQSD